jgi:hypothetical protein
MSLFHNFPRRSPGDDTTTTLKRGLEILKFIVDTGLMLVPEILTWGTSDMQIQLCQVRFCLTELEMSDIGEHSKLFGEFAIELSPEMARKLGALPVLYMPQSLRQDKALSGVGTSLIVAIEEIRHLLEMMDELEVRAKSFPEASVIKARHMGRSRVDGQEYVMEQFDLNASEAQKVLEYLGIAKHSYRNLANWAVCMQNTLYPTDDERHDKQLAYYRQREWRIVAGLGKIEGAQDRELTESEKQRLIQIDSTFWQRELTHQLSAGNQTFRRVDRTRVIEFLDGKRIATWLTSVYVPDAAYDEAASSLGSHVPIQRIPS